MTDEEAVRFERVPVDHPDAHALLLTYFAELNALLGGFDASQAAPAAAEFEPATRGAFVVLYEAGTAVACGGLREQAPGVGEIKRMFVAPAARGRGHARRLLEHLEALARAAGHTRMVLDTAEPLADAAALYRKNGYREIPPYNDNPYAARWFTKALA